MKGDLGTRSRRNKERKPTDEGRCAVGKKQVTDRGSCEAGPGDDAQLTNLRSRLLRVFSQSGPPFGESVGRAG